MRLIGKSELYIFIVCLISFANLLTEVISSLSFIFIYLTSTSRDGDGEVSQSDFIRIMEKTNLF